MLPELKTTLTADPFSPKKLIQVLSQHKPLHECYALAAGVFEGYTVAQHTLMVLENAERYHHQLHDTVAPLTWPQFRLFLALHDIGKGLAFQNAPYGANAFQMKKNELQQTQAIIKQFCHDQAIPEHTQCIYLSLLQNDTIGNLLKGTINTESAYEELLKNAPFTLDELSNFFNLMVTFHQVDASSYPLLLSNLFHKDAGAAQPNLQYTPPLQNKIDQLDHKLTNLAEGFYWFETIRDSINGQSHSLHKSAKVFLKNIDAITQFFRYQNQTFIRSNLDSHENNQKFRLFYIQSSRIILELTRLLSAEYYDQHQQRLKLTMYADHTTNSAQSSILMILQELERLTHTSINRFQRQSFAYELLATHNYYYNRIKQASIKSEDFPCNTLTFLHGSKGKIFNNLSHSNFHLLSTGRLTTLGIIPQTGERYYGCSPHGINQIAISGTNLRNARTAIQYAKQSNQKSLETIRAFHQWVFDKDLKTSFDFITLNLVSRISSYKLALQQLKASRHPEDLECFANLKNHVKDCLHLLNLRLRNETSKIFTIERITLKNKESLEIARQKRDELSSKIKQLQDSSAHTYIQKTSAKASELSWPKMQTDLLEFVRQSKIISDLLPNRVSFLVEIVERHILAWQHNGEKKAAEKIMEAFTKLVKAVSILETKLIQEERHLTRALHIQEFGHHDDYYKKNHDSLLHELFETQTIIEKTDVQSAHDQITRDIPVIFASNSTHPEFLQDIEQIVRTPLRLGEDIQFMIVQMSDIKAAEVILDKYHLTGDIQIIAMESLKIAAKNHKQTTIPPYLSAMALKRRMGNAPSPLKHRAYKLHSSLLHPSQRCTQSAKSTSERNNITNRLNA